MIMTLQISTLYWHIPKKLHGQHMDNNRKKPINQKKLIYLHMKLTLPHILIFLLLFSACGEPKPIDSVFRWPSSGVAEADSLLLQFEREYASMSGKVLMEKISERFCSISNAHPDNNLLQFRNDYIKAILMPSSVENRQYLDFIKKAKEKIDSADHHYDWHMMTSLEIITEQDYVARYYKIIDNIAYFKKVNAKAEEATHLRFLGNLMHDFKDENRASYAHKEAIAIFDSLNLIPDLMLSRLNLAITYPRATSDSMYAELRKDTLYKHIPSLYIQLMQNSFNRTDSVEFIDEAIETSKKFDTRSLPVLFALKGDYLTRHEKNDEGLSMINKAFDLIEGKPFRTQYIILMHFFKAVGLYENGKTDSAFSEMYQSWTWRDSLDKELNKPGVYAMDAKTRIDMADKNASLEYSRVVNLWIISILILAIFILVIIYQYKRRIDEKRYKEILMEKQLKKNRQSIAAQSVVMEESENILAEISSRLTKLMESERIDQESVNTIIRILKLHKSNEENRQSFLQIQNEIDTNFMIRLKSDFPSLSESQIRLASLIVSGADSRQICSILNIEQASVHKSRYRLRSRLGLKTDDSLEDFLRRYNNSPE